MPAISASAGERLADVQPRDMAPALDQPLRADDDGADGIGLAGKHPGIQQAIPGAAEERGVEVIQLHQVAAQPRRDAAERAAAGLGAAGERRVEQPPAGMRRCLRRRHRAFVQGQALAGLQLPQLVARRDADMAVGADAEPAAGGQVIAQREDAVAERGLGEGQRPATAPVAASAAHSAASYACAWIRHQRASAGVVQQPLHRPRAGGGEALRHLLRLFCGVDVDRAGRGGDAPAASRASPRAGCAAPCRRRLAGRPRWRRGRPRRCQNGSRSFRKRRCPGTGARAEAAMAIRLGSRVMPIPVRRAAARCRSAISAMLS